MKTFFITGAEGVGKSTILDLLVKKFPKIDFHDFDELGVPEDPPLQWRLDTTKYWIKKSVENQVNGISTCIIGLSFPEEIIKFDDFKKLKNISFCLLDISDEERESRLKKRGAARDVIDYKDSLLNLKKQFGKIDGEIIDSSKLSIEETFERLKEVLK